MLKKMAMVVVCVAMMAGTAQAYDVLGDGTWTEGPFAFTPSSNGYWDGTTAPDDLGGPLDIAYNAPGPTGVAHVDDDPVNGRANVTSTNLQLGWNKRGLLVVDGDFSCTSAGYIGRGTGHGKVVVRDGATFTSSATLNVGFHNKATLTSGHGEFVIEGGTVTWNVAGDMLVCGTANGTLGEVVQTGGDVTGTGRVKIQTHTNGTGSYTISGGSFDITNTARYFDVGLASGPGTGLLHVIGSGATITNVMRLNMNATGTLKFTVQGPTVSVINASNGLTVDAGAVLDMELDGYTPVLGETFDLIQVTSGNVNAGLNLTLSPEDVGVWEVIDPQGGQTLQVRYLLESSQPIPEPGSAALLLLGGALGLRRRRR